MLRINAPRGLGDAIHVRAVCLHLLSKGENLCVFTRWPEVFSGLAIDVRAEDEQAGHRDLRSVRACFQCQIPYIRDLSQFRNACMQAGVFEPIELNIGWKIRNSALLKGIMRHAGRRPIMCYQPLKVANNADDDERRPSPDVFRRMVNDCADYFRIRLGHPKFTPSDETLECELDLLGKVSVADAIDVVTAASLVCSEASYLGILAQAFKKKFTCLFARRGLESTSLRVAGVTPQRIFHAPELCTAVIDG